MRLPIRISVSVEDCGDIALADTSAIARTRSRRPANFIFMPRIIRLRGCYGLPQSLLLIDIGQWLSGFAGPGARLPNQEITYSRILHLRAIAQSSFLAFVSAS